MVWWVRLAQPSDKWTRMGRHTMATGIANAKYAPVAPILKIAAIASEPAKIRQSIITWTKKLNMQALIGVRV